MTASTSFRKKIVEFLGTGQLDPLRRSSEEEWNSNMRWLDRSGLALPLAAQLESLGPSAGLPSNIESALRVRLQDNGKRMEAMLRFFADANRALAGAGAQYCCVKGFSLIPDCCGSIRERHQVDLDFLISPRDSDRAREAIESLGYRMMDAGASGEMRFAKPWKKHLGVNAYLYQAPEPPAIELHTSVWEPEAQEIDFPAPSGFLEGIEMHVVAGVRFPRLGPPQQFVYLLLHIFRHLLGSWCRLLSLYEVAALLRSQSENTQLWKEVARIIERDEPVASACALVLRLVGITFPAELPQPLAYLCEKSLSPESSLWLKSYSSEWLFADPPGTKLALLVQRQFCPDRRTWRQYVRRRLVPLRKAPALCEDAAPATTRTLAYRKEEMRYGLSRIWYHVRSDCEYLLARFKWRQLLHAREC